MIMELSMDQLRVMVYDAIKLENSNYGKTLKAIDLLEATLP